MEFRGAPKKKPLRVGTVQTVDVDTGEVTATRGNAFTVLPPRGDVCPECAVDHPAADPHNQQSLAYQYQFRATHGRWPTWTDAMSHCPPATREIWREKLVAVLTENGLPVPPDLQDSGPGPGGR